MQPLHNSTWQQYTVAPPYYTTLEVRAQQGQAARHEYHAASIAGLARVIECTAATRTHYNTILHMRLITHSRSTGVHDITVSAALAELAVVVSAPTAHSIGSLSFSVAMAPTRCSSVSHHQRAQHSITR
eukprot:8453-Heterococcus_DN1.PRE.2